MKAYTKDILFIELTSDEVRQLHKELLSITKMKDVSLIPILEDLLSRYLNVLHHAEILKSETL